MSGKRQVLGLIVLLAVTLAASAVGSLVTYPNIQGWYDHLAKPSWNPPNWVFGPVWSALYVCMAVAAWLVWRQGGLWSAKVPLTLFAVQLALNTLWSCIFFGLQSPGLAFVEVLVLWAAIIATAAAFWQWSMIAGILLVPYLAWVSFASVLNLAIWRLNG